MSNKIRNSKSLNIDIEILDLFGNWIFACPDMGMDLEIN
jgi:hypothetical protein